MRGGAGSDVDQSVIRDPGLKRSRQARHQKSGPLIDGTVGDHQLVVREGDRAVVGGGRDDLVWAHRLSEPSPRVLGGHLREQRPDLAALPLRRLQALAIRGPACVLIERVNVDRCDQPVALSQRRGGAASGLAQQVMRRGFVSGLRGGELS